MKNLSQPQGKRSGRTQWISLLYSYITYTFLPWSVHLTPALT